MSDNRQKASSREIQRKKIFCLVRVARRFSLPSGVVATALGAVFAVSQFEQEKVNAQPPNIILIVTDDQGYGDSGLLGNQQINTPNIDSIARNGVEFTRFYVEPVCAVTRASLMTLLLPHGCYPCFRRRRKDGWR